MHANVSIGWMDDADIEACSFRYLLDHRWFSADCAAGCGAANGYGSLAESVRRRAYGEERLARAGGAGLAAGRRQHLRFRAWQQDQAATCARASRRVADA